MDIFGIDILFLLYHIFAALNEKNPIIIPNEKAINLFHLHRIILISQ